MQYALPVIGRRSGATPEIIEDGISGFLYDDINGLEEAMEKLIRDRDLRSALGKS
jgi:glycosyltransferase involved in cell wall biosynthesis